jgi:hypothetical protein
MSLLALFPVASDVRRGVFLVIFSVLAGVCASWLGITAMQRARRSGSLRPASSIAGTVLGVIGSALSALMLILFVTFWPQVTTLSRCLDAANTVSAHQACVDQFHRSVRISQLGGG